MIKRVYLSVLLLWMLSGMVATPDVFAKGAPAVYSIEKNNAVQWSEEELVQEVALRLIEETAHASRHAVHLRGVEAPHTHESDLIVFVMKGRANVHIGEATVEVEKGDVINIAANVVHWAENTGDEPAEAYAVFAPPLKQESPATGTGK